jgi:hypothetical protein
LNAVRAQPRRLLAQDAQHPLALGKRRIEAFDVAGHRGLMLPQPGGVVEQRAARGAPCAASERVRIAVVTAPEIGYNSWLGSGPGAPGAARPVDPNEPERR